MSGLERQMGISHVEVGKEFPPGQEGSATAKVQERSGASALKALRPQGKSTKRVLEEMAGVGGGVHFVEGPECQTGVYETSQRAVRRA